MGDDENLCSSWNLVENCDYNKRVMSQPTKDILLCDDHPICQMGVEYVLQSSHPEPFHLRKVANGNEALEEIKKKMPDVLVLDLGLPDFSGAELIRAIREIAPSLKIIVLTNCDSPPILRQVLQYRVQALLQKTHSIENLKTVFKAAHDHSGIPYVDPTIEKLLAQVSTRPSLTPREFEVLEWIAKGHTSREIANILKCSSETVKSHRSNIMAKINVRNTAEMMAAYLQGKVK